MHERTHNKNLTEKRGDTLITRGMRIFSSEMGISGQCDVLEFHRNNDGISINGQEGKWLVYPVEYKNGKPKENNCDNAQLCAQAICLEEMLCCRIPEGSLFYGETKRRTRVAFTDELREIVKNSFIEMHNIYDRKHTPKVRPKKSCNICSLKELCLPILMKDTNVHKYLEDNI